MLFFSHGRGGWVIRSLLICIIMWGCSDFFVDIGKKRSVNIFSGKKGYFSNVDPSNYYQVLIKFYDWICNYSKNQVSSYCVFYTSATIATLGTKGMFKPQPRKSYNSDPGPHIIVASSLPHYGT